MAYRVVFTNGEKRELVIEATLIKHNSSSASLEFFDDSRGKVALVPIDRILYVKKVDED